MADRLDLILVARGLASSRARAQADIKAGRVQVNGLPSSKASQTVADDADIVLETSGPVWVSRAAEKLVGGLQAFNLDVEGKTALDVGASTGGFTQVLLSRGATRVYAVDVGHGQMVPLVRKDPRVICLEGVNAKALTQALIPDAPQMIVSDVSFIGLEKALPAALSLAASGAWLIALIKPQFEVGPGKVGRGGIVKDEALHTMVCEHVRKWLAGDMGWRVEDIVDSPITGGDGNKEFLIGAQKP